MLRTKLYKSVLISLAIIATTACGGTEPSHTSLSTVKPSRAENIKAPNKMTGRDKFFSFRFIGHPANEDAIGGDDSNGRSIMVPLKSKGGQALECGENSSTNDTEPSFTEVEPVGTKIYFEASEDDSAHILDRDATDKDGARIAVPVDDEGNITFDIVVRALGKPNTCMNADGWAYDGEYYFWSGSLTVTRNKGKPVYVNANDLFDVWYCDVDEETGACIDDTQAEISVFDSTFASYFWNVNGNTRNVEVRLYQRN